MNPSNTKPLIIRPAHLGDAARLAELSGQLGYPATAEQMAERLRRMEGDSGQQVWVAEGPGAIVVGWIDVLMHRLLVSDREAEIGGLVVDEACRGQGVGRRLMKQAEQWARGKGCAAVRLRSNVVREEAHAFYEKLGYRVFKTQKNFRKML